MARPGWGPRHSQPWYFLRKRRSHMMQCSFYFAYLLLKTCLRNAFLTCTGPPEPLFAPPFLPECMCLQSLKWRGRPPSLRVQHFLDSLAGCTKRLACPAFSPTSRRNCGNWIQSSPSPTHSFFKSFVHCSSLLNAGAVVLVCFATTNPQKKLQLFGWYLTKNFDCS